MAISRLSIHEFLKASADHPVLDVRSPGEFTHAHFPGAISFPLFTDEERAVVGTLYKQKSREDAIKAGLDFFGPKMRGMVETAESILKENNSTSKQVFVYCWRGGMRSAGVAWLLDLYGFKVHSLVGGYKSFRRFVLDSFLLPFQLRILGGYTGSGKTELLKSIQEKGAAIIDLEALANHKGSAFGNIGLPEQPSQEMFDNLLGLALYRLTGSGAITDGLRNMNRPIWLEDESQRIGKVNIHPDFWKQMRSSPIWFLDIPFEERLDHLVAEYGELDREKMIEAIGRISSRLGGLETKNAIRFLQEGNTKESFRILLKYYDKWYHKGLHNRAGLEALLHTVLCERVGSQNIELMGPLSPKGGT